MAGDDTSARDCVLACDTERTALLKEEKELLDSERQCRSIGPRAFTIPHRHVTAARGVCFVPSCPLHIPVIMRLLPFHLPRREGRGHGGGAPEGHLRQVRTADL